MSKTVSLPLLFTVAVWKFLVNRLNSLVLKQEKVCAVLSQLCNSFLTEIKKDHYNRQKQQPWEGEVKQLNMGYNNWRQNFLLLTAKNCMAGCQEQESQQLLTVVCP